MNEKKERCIRLDDADYPESLRSIADAPKQLYVRGSLPDQNRPSVALIGSRQCSIYGREMARWFGERLAGAGVQIISGMARGVDGIAQLAALNAGGQSYGVLGCGTDICYPKENKKLYEMLPASGGLLSEYPPGMPPLSHHFPKRNRIISALSDCVLVIEAKERSGTLITADFALEQGREVYALPGRLSDALSGGCNRLLFQGAGLALSPEDILEFLCGSGKYPEWEKSGREKGEQKKREQEKGKQEKGKQEKESKTRETLLLHGKEHLIWEAMGERPIGLQELYERVRSTREGRELTLPEVTGLLMGLVARKIIWAKRGNKYCRKEENGVSTI